MNSWNKVIYKIWSPFYDYFFNTGAFLKARESVFQNISFQEGQKILFVGVGTGADIEMVLHHNLNITAIDFSKDMLNKAKAKYHKKSIVFQEMDAQNLTFEDEDFDIIVASLILSVVPNPERCLQEMTRVVKPQGKIIIFNKFAPVNQRLSISKKIMKGVIKVLGTDISLVFEDIFQKNNQLLRIEEDTPIMMNGMYRKIVIRKIKNTAI
nr:MULTISPECIES: class I SAM-dependent methyltransferase [Bacillus]